MFLVLLESYGSLNLDIAKASAACRKPVFICMYRQSDIAALMQTLMAMTSLVTHMLPAHGLVPNCSICKCPLLLYKRAFDPQKHSDLASHIEETFASHGYDPQWRYRMYDRRGPLPSALCLQGALSGCFQITHACHSMGTFHYLCRPGPSRGAPPTVVTCSCRNICGDDNLCRRGCVTSCTAVQEPLSQHVP